MILLSVAHSASAKGAYNPAYSVSEYELSQIMTSSCKSILDINQIPCDVLDVGKMRPYMSYKLNYIRRVKPELAIEIHLNSGNKNADYPMCVYYKNNALTKRCAQIILNNLKTGFEKQGWTKVRLLEVPTEIKGFDNSRYTFVTKTPCPSIIVEPLFISNNEQCKYLLSHGALNSIGEMIGEAILDWHAEKTHKGAV